MKKEELEKVLQFIKYVGKNMTVKHEDFEYFRDTVYDCECILREELNGYFYCKRRINGKKTECGHQCHECLGVESEQLTKKLDK